MKYDVPFVPNTPDDLHCFQAAFMMILMYFKPDMDMPWETFCKITGFEEGKGTWASAGILWFKSQGFDVRHVTLFDYEDFATDGGDYLIRMYGPEVGYWQIEHSNLPLEQERARLLLQSGIAEKREPTQADIKEYLKKGYLVDCLINMNKLNDEPGYVGHSIVVIGYDKTGFIIHDPGAPPLKDRHVPYDVFERAWADPSAENKEISAVKLG